MKNLNEFLKEEDDAVSAPDARKSMVQFIVSNFFRFVQNPDLKDDRNLLLLVAAISLLNMGDDLQTINAARRLAQVAISRNPKSKKKDK